MQDKCVLKDKSCVYCCFTPRDHLNSWYSYHAGGQWLSFIVLFFEASFIVLWWKVVGAETCVWLCVIIVPVMLDEAVEYLENRQVRRKFLCPRQMLINNKIVLF